MEHSYGIDCDLVLRCDDVSFCVNRDVITEASPVLRAMLKGSFAESRMPIIHLEGDNPEAFKQALDVIYAGLLGTVEISTIPVDSQPLIAIIDKYELNGARLLVCKEITERKMRSELQQQVVDLQARHQVALESLKREQRIRLMQPGMTVDYIDRPPVGTRVQENKDDRRFRAGCQRMTKTGAIIANDEDGGSEIGVRWDDGSQSHNLWCNKKGGHALIYA